MSRPTPPLCTTVRTSSDGTTVCAYGEVDLATADQLARTLVDVAATRPGRVVVDLSGVGFLDARGLAALLRGRRALAASGGELVLASPSRMVRRMLHLLDLEHVLPVQTFESTVSSDTA